MSTNITVENFKPSDLQKYIDTLGNQSSSLDEVKDVLKNLLFFVAQGNDDSLAQILNKGAVTILIKLLIRYNNEKFVKQKVSSVLIILGQKGDDDFNSLVNSLANIFTGSDFNMFMECLNGIKEIVFLASGIEGETAGAAAGSGSSGSGKGGGGGGGGGSGGGGGVGEGGSGGEGPPSGSARPHSLSISAACALFVKLTSLLKSTSVKDAEKLEALDVFMELVDNFVLNEAAEFAAWTQSKTKGDGRGTPSAQFFSSFSAFSDTLKEISSVKRRSALCSFAERIYECIQEKTFFPTPIPVPVPLSGAAASGGGGAATAASSLPVSLPMKFMVNTLADSGISRTDTKISWGSVSAWASFFVDHEITAGMYKVEIEADCANYNCNYTFVGLCAKAQLTTISRDTAGCNNNGPGNCFFHTSSVTCGGTQSNVSVFSNVRKHLFGLELDADKGVLSLFVDGVQVPHVVVNVPKSVYFAANGVYPTQIFELKSFQKLASPTTNPSLACTQHVWK